MTVGESVENNNNNAISSCLHVVPSALKRAVSGVNVTRRLDLIMRLPDPIEVQNIKLLVSDLMKRALDASVISPWPQKEFRHKASVDRPYAKKTYKCYHSL